MFCIHYSTCNITHCSIPHLYSLIYSVLSGTGTGILSPDHFQGAIYKLLSLGCNSICKNIAMLFPVMNRMIIYGTHMVVYGPVWAVI